MKNRNTPGLFDRQERMDRLNNLKDPLVSIGQTIDFESFRSILESATLQSSYSQGGRPPFDRVMLFKALVLQKLYHLSDEQLEYQINDRLSFMRFLGLRMSDKVPDQKTFWYFRESLTKTGVIDKAFILFRDSLRDNGYIVHEGKIVDASIVKAPIQRNTREENNMIKKGEIPEDWSDAKRRQKDMDADWVKRHGKSFFGYKNHLKTESTNKLIDEFQVTQASVHDSQVIEELLDETDAGKPLWADSAYYSDGIKKVLRKRRIGCRIHKKGTKNVSLTKAQKESNRIKSRIRCRVEHVFAAIQNRIKGPAIRCVGIVRATAEITLMNLVYNMTRIVSLNKMAGQSVTS